MDTKKELSSKAEEMSIRFQNAAAVDIERMKLQEAECGRGTCTPDTFADDISLPEQYREGYFFYKGKYEAIRDSTFWRMTGPLRSAADWLRWKTAGIKREVDPDEQASDESVSQAQKAGSGTLIGVHVHLFYADLLSELCQYLKHIPERFDLYFSCREDADEARIRKAASRIPHVGKVVVRKGPNRGRDIAPFYVLFGQELSQYELLLHVHTKKSLYTGEEKKEWRQWALDGVLKDERTVKKILGYLRAAHPDAGLVFGEMTPMLPLMALHWLYNSGRGKEILGQLHLRFEDHMFFYPVGSFFWAKTNAIRPLFDLGLTYESFDEENGQVDGTLAHALERVIACVVKERGYGMYIFDPESDSFAWNKSYKSFRKYFSYDVKNIGKLLLQNYDLISFDIFDTLITRILYEPDDVFRFIERLLRERSGKSVDYLRLRKKAEEAAWKERGDFCNIHDIYGKLPLISDFSIEEARELEQLELELELDFCIARNDVRELFNQAVAAGKRVVLVSDTYLTGDVVEKMLKKCGYEGYSELWLSCERGKRKDSGDLWDEFFDRYGAIRTIHVGDNPHSDDQVVGDRRKPALLLLSPVEQFRLSEQYEKYQRFLDGSVENSLILGYMVNKCFYNSPFALKENGFSRINALENMIEGIFAPLFLQFMDYLQRTSHKNTRFLFLSREGYFLQKLYQVYCRAFRTEARENLYFLTSRRAASVAQIVDYEDAKELLYREYSGKLSTLLSERFGLDGLSYGEEEMISLPGDMARAASRLSEHAVALLSTAQRERKAYLEYIRQTLGSDTAWEQVTLVDVGYSGTIQYYLMKILETQLDACYMVTGYSMKPDCSGGTYRGLYNFYQTPLFDDTQLFLEAVTAAPHGQVVHFFEKDGHMDARLKAEKSVYGENARAMQQYMYQYLEKMGKWSHNLQLHFRKDLSATIFSEILRVGILGKEAEGMFQVDDGYCMDGSWIYDEVHGDWKLEKDGQSTWLNKVRTQSRGK